MPSVLPDLRGRLGAALFLRVAGPDGPRHRERIHFRDGPRWFEAGSPITRVHGDASMFVGGLRALLLQTLHPAAMRAVSEHSGYRGDMWGRLHRTSTFLAVTTFGVADDAEQAVDAVRRIHERVVGTMPDGTPYAASDPHLLAWVHAAEADSFLRAHQVYGRAAARPGRARRVRRPDRPGRRAARGARPADDGGRARPRCSRRTAPSCAAPARPARRSARAAQAAAAPGRAAAVRRARGGRHRADARLDPAAAAAALPAGLRAHRRCGCWAVLTTGTIRWAMSPSQETVMSAVGPVGPHRGDPAVVVEGHHVDRRQRVGLLAGLGRAARTGTPPARPRSAR